MSQTKPGSEQDIQQYGGKGSGPSACVWAGVDAAKGPVLKFVAFCIGQLNFTTVAL